MAQKNLFSWAAKQPDWRRDALRRHAQSTSFLLNEDDKAAVVARVQKAAGFEQEGELENTPLADDHINIDKPTGPKTLLASLGPVKNLARIATGQLLTFCLDGLTVVYGDNASGKSGYCRITKKVCRSQTTDELLGNVFIDGPTPPAEVLIRFLYEGDEEPTEVSWKDGTPPPKAIRSIFVFDSRNARFYIDQHNRVEFLPLEISLLESHAGHCKEMQAGFESERLKLEQQIRVPLPAGFTPGGTVASALEKLALRVADLPSIEALTEMSAWTDADKVELEALGKTLAQDPSALASRDDRAKAALLVYKDSLQKIEDGLSIGVADAAKTKHEEAKAASDAATLAAETAFASEPLPGVGEGPWRQMYDYAKAYVIAAGIGSQVPANTNELCVLCQQPLSEEASARLTRFNEYVAGEAAKKNLEAAAAIEAAKVALSSLAIPDKESITGALAEYSAIGDPQSRLVKEIEDYVVGANARRDALVAACGTGDFSAIPGLPKSLVAEIKQIGEGLQKSADEYRDQAKLDTMRKQSVARQNELKDREKLNDILPIVLARRADLEKHGKLTKCEQLVDTQQLSTFITAYRRELFTESLQTRIQTEIDNLDLGHIPFAVVDRSKDGKSEFKVGIKAKFQIANDKVLSEGEQRALALACFLAEAAGDDVLHGMVIDDPVSSLDHLRIRKVAKRLVDEAGKGRQVIVFTHNLLFYNEILREAAAAEPQVKTVRRVVSKSAADGFGIVSDEAEPWSARKVTTRISDLQKRRAEIEANHSDFNTEAYRRVAKDFYTDLRETWERLVETVLLATVVERYSSDVRTQSLKAVQVEDEDYRVVFHAMKRVSERSGHDMAAGKQIPTPNPTDMKADLELIEKYRTAVKKRSEETDKRRRAEEGPPAGKVMLSQPVHPK